MARVDVIAPNFKKRLSGVTSTIAQLIPLQARSLGIAALGPGLPHDLPRMRWRQLPGLLKRPASGRPRIWHARRNVEMTAGIVLKAFLRAPLLLLFTSAAQRHHKPFTRALIRAMDAVIATSDRSGGFLEVPHAVVMHGVDLAAFHPKRLAEDDWAASGLPGRYGIGCFGRVRHQKGTDLFVDAMIALLPGFPEWTAVITGRTTPEHRAFERDLRHRVAAAGLTERIVFLGEVPDIKVWYRRLSLYVAPPRVEGFGLTPLEAMASGVPVVASDAGAYAEMILDGETGAVVPAGDGDALREAIRRYMGNSELLGSHGKGALADVRARFSLEREAEGIARVYEELWARDGR